MNLAPAIYDALVGYGPIQTLLGSWRSGPSIHTKRPVPQDAGYPMIVVSPDITFNDEDALRTQRNVVVRDIAVYGESPKHYRDVEAIAYMLRTLFHRNRFSIDPSGFHVIDIVARGPVIAPTDDTSKVGRVVSLTIRAQPL